MSRPAHNPQTVLQFVESTLGDWEECPVRSCKGYLIKVYVRYKNRGRVFEEYECHLCGKVKREKRGQYGQQNYHNRQRRSE